MYLNYAEIFAERETLEGKVEAYEVKPNFGVMELRRDGTTDLCI